ncbi:hypothetical protein ACEWY4_021529 [Coilia grayii]|uniref:Uncharacterized protein n=1 Tax=Coilia grayii TaxID=363190 RepID=A0ABD1J978_9TELE
MDPDKIISILKELYGCSKSYVALQEAFFSRKQQEGETLQEFSLALLSLMDKVKQSAPNAVPNSDVLLRDQFTEHVIDGALCQELKQLVRRQPRATLLEVRAEAIRWERECMPGATRARRYSLPSTQGIQYGVQGWSRLPGGSQSHSSELAELKEILKQQQDQLNQLTQSIASLQGPRQFHRSSPRQSVICRRCQRPGHYARDFDGERVLQQTQSSFPPADRPFSGNSPQLPTPAGNLYPPNSNGLAIPYIGYMELDVQLCGKQVPNCGILVVKDPVEAPNNQVPGVLGMNVLSKCYQELFCKYGVALLEDPSSRVLAPLLKAFQHCHQAEVQPLTSVVGRVKLRVVGEEVREHLQVVADRRKAYHDMNARDAPLEEGQRVYLRDQTVRGRHKIHDLWSPVVYQVMKAPPQGGSVYTVAPEGNIQQVKHVHRTLLKACVERPPSGDCQPEGPSTLHNSCSNDGESDEEDLLVTAPGTSMLSGRQAFNPAIPLPCLPPASRRVP